MTFLQPNKNSRVFRIFIFFAAFALIVGTFGLIALYNRTVSLDHAVSAAKAEFDAVGAENTALNNKIVTMLGDTDRLAALAAADGLVIDPRPQYLGIAQ